MLEVTKIAQDMLTGYLKEQNQSSPLRVYLSGG